jgi:signal peptidase I
MPTEPPPPHILAAAPGLWSEAGQGHWVPVQGPSMLPFLQPGDEMWVAPRPAKLRRGDVVVLMTPSGLLVHRLLRAEPWSQPQQLWTHGDNNRLPDPAASAEDLLGRVLTVRRRGRVLALDTPRWRACGWSIAIGLLVLNGLTTLAGSWGAPGRLAAGGCWRLLRVFRTVAGR